MNQNFFLPRYILSPHFKDNLITGAEIGAGGGNGSEQILLQVPTVKTLYCIDTWAHIDGSMFEAARPQEWHDLGYAKIQDRLKNYKDRYVILKMRSDDAVHHVPDDLDFVWIDGAHEKAQVERDLLNWIPKVKIGGIVGGHDYQIHYIRDLVKEHLGLHCTGEDFTWWKIRREDGK